MAQAVNTILASPVAVPTGHASQITITLVGSGTAWVQNTTVFTLQTAPAGTVFDAAGAGFLTATTTNGTVTSGTTATVVIHTGATAATTATIKDGTTTSSIVAVLAPVLTIFVNGGIQTNPVTTTQAATGTTPTITLSETNALWNVDTPTFTISGGGNSLAAATGFARVAERNTCQVVATLGAAAAGYTITDPSTGATATLTVQASGTPFQCVHFPAMYYSNTAFTATITCATGGASIFYTLNNTTPTAGSNAYSGPITVPPGATLKSIAILAGVSSIVTSSVYQLAIQQPGVSPQNVLDMTNNLVVNTSGKVLPIPNAGSSTSTGGSTTAGTTSLVLTSATGFSPNGYISVPTQPNPIIYTGISTNTLTGIPASGYGSILATIPTTTAVTGLGTYYWYGLNRMGTETVNSDTDNAPIGCYSSPDLFNWWNEGNIVALTDPNVRLGRPKVVYNVSTSKYVLFTHYNLTSPATNEICCWTSSNPNNGFTLDGGSPFVADGLATFDIDVFVDTNATAYLISSNVTTNHITTLNAAYTGAVGSSTYTPFAGSFEAYSVFLYNGVYFMVYSSEAGYAATVEQHATATSMAGPWTIQDTGSTSFCVTSGQPLGVIGVPSNSTWCQDNCIFQVIGTNNFVWQSEIWNAGGLSASHSMLLPLLVGTQVPSGTSTSLQCLWMNQWSPYWAFPVPASSASLPARRFIH